MKKDKEEPKNPFLELMKVAQEESIYYRQKAIKNWWDAWITDIESEQTVLNNKYLGLQHREIIKERLGMNCIDQCMSEIANIIEKDREISVSFKAIRRKPR